MNGPAAGLGMIIALYADIRFASDSAIFNTAFSKRGLVAEHGISWMLPLIVGFPAAFIGAFFTGSLLIETLFSLDGLGLLSYESVVRRDYPVVLGTLYLFTLIGLATKLISDLCYVWVDPRIQFEQLER